MKRCVLLAALSILLVAPTQAGLLFDDAATEGLATAGITSGIDDNTITAHVLFYPDDTGNVGTLFGVHNDGSEVVFHNVIAHGLSGAGDDRVRGYSSNLANGQKLTDASGPAYTVDAWQTGQAVWNGDSSRAVWVDGAGKNTNTDTTDPAAETLDRESVGFRYAATPINYFSGRIGQVAVYSSALSDGEVESLGAGMWPPYVASASLVVFLTCTGDVAGSDDRAANNLINGGKWSNSSEPSKIGHKNLCPWPGMQ